MKKRCLKSLQLNKKSISNFQDELNGGWIFPQTRFGLTCHAPECNLDSLPPVQTALCKPSVDICMTV